MREKVNQSQTIACLRALATLAHGLVAEAYHPSNIVTWLNKPTGLLAQLHSGTPLHRHIEQWSRLAPQVSSGLRGMNLLTTTGEPHAHGGVPTKRAEQPASPVFTWNTQARHFPKTFSFSRQHPVKFSRVFFLPLPCGINFGFRFRAQPPKPRIRSRPHPPDRAEAQTVPQISCIIHNIYMIMRNP